MNCADLIRNDITIINLNGSSVGPAELHNRYCFFKHKIHTLLDGQTLDRTVFFAGNDFDFMVPALKALWELGCSVFVHESHTEFSKIPAFKNFWDLIDIVVKFDRITFGLDDRPTLNSATDYDSRLDYSKLLHSRDPITHDHTVAVKTHSSGTMGFPKIINYTHAQVSRVANKHLEWENLGQHVRPVHFKTMHHGALFIDYALPLLAACDTHWWIDARTVSQDPIDFFNLVLPIMHHKQLNKILIPYDWLDYIHQCAAIDFKKQLEMVTIRPYSPTTADYLFTRINPREVINSFGCSEVGVMFMNRCTHENVHDYAPNVFDWIADDIEFEIYSDHVRVRREGGSWHHVPDRLKLESGKVHFLGRNMSLERGGDTIYVHDLQEFLKTMWPASAFQIVPDFESKKIFLAVFDDKISCDTAEINDLIDRQLGPKYRVTDTGYFETAKILQGMKPSGPLLLYAFLNRKTIK